MNDPDDHVVERGLRAFSAFVAFRWPALTYAKRRHVVELLRAAVDVLEADAPPLAKVLAIKRRRAR